MEEKPFEQLTDEEKNVILTERLLGLNVIYPEDYYRNLKVKDADRWRAQAPDNNNPVVVKNNRPLHTHWIDASALPDFYADNAHALIAVAREKMREKNLHLKFVCVLSATISAMTRAHGNFRIVELIEENNWKLVNSSPRLQADAMVQMLLVQPPEEEVVEEKAKGKKKSKGRAVRPKKG